MREAVATHVVETRYEVRSYRDPDDPRVRHDAHAVYRATRVPARIEALETTPRNKAAPVSYAPLPPSAELAAEIAKQKEIGAELRAIRSRMAGVEQQARAQLGTLADQTAETVNLRKQLEEERTRVRELESKVFDEIEKAHREVLDVLLQLLDAGRLTTGANRVLDFSPWYVVLTSNIGAQRIMAMRKSKYETMERLVRQDAQRELRPEILGRITASIVFDKLGYDIQCRIAEGMVERELSAHRARGYLMKAGAGVLEAIIQRGYNDRLGARPMRDAVELLVRNALSENLLNGGRGIGELRGHPTGTKLELLPTATAVAA